MGVLALFRSVSGFAAAPFDLSMRRAIAYGADPFSADLCHRTGFVFEIQRKNSADRAVRGRADHPRCLPRHGQVHQSRGGALRGLCR